MSSSLRRLVLRGLVLPVLLLLLSTLQLPAANWPGWRGDGSGISPETNLPVAWTTTENVAWKIALPGEGNSSPVVWGDRIFLTASGDHGQQRSVLCLDVKDGHLLWRRDLAAERTPHTDQKNGYASPTPVTDGASVFAFFDSPGVVALDWDGNVRWTRDLGPFKNPYNMAESPILYRDLVIMNCDQDTGGFIVALDKATGQERWRTPRAYSSHYATPLIATFNGKDQVIVNAKIIVAYDPLTGKEFWRCKGMTPTVTPSPVAADGLVYATSGRNGPTLAIDPTGHGDVSETHVRLRATTGGPYVPSPLVYPFIMLPGDNGTLRVLDHAGNILLDLRAPGHFTSSPVAGDGKIYWASEKGDVYVIEAGQLTAEPPSLRLLSVNALNETFLASPAIAGGRLYLRSTQTLFCIAGQRKVPTVAAGSGPASFEELARRYADHPAPTGPDVNVRVEVVERLASNSDPRALRLLQDAALNDKHWDVGEAAVKSLAQLGAPATNALMMVLDLSKDWQPYLKVTAAQALGRLQVVAALPLLAKGAGNRDPLVRAECVRALGGVLATAPAQLPAMLPAITGRMRDTDSVVREAAATALGRQTGTTGPAREAVVDLLLDGAADQDPLVVKSALESQRRLQVSDAVIKRDERLYGAPRKKPISCELHAGPVRLKFQDGELRYLYVGEKEIIRRIYFGVRDPRFDTVMPQLNAIDIQQQEQAFTIKLAATCQNDTVSYRWTGTITGTADGKITFDIDGQANADFKSPRVGMCVLFGTSSLGGQPYELLDAAGTATAGTFPVAVTGSLLAKLDSFRLLRYTTPDGLTVSVGLRDQNFGLEDQRNYGDSSFKAMSGMAYVYPNVAAGKPGRQSLTVQVTNANAPAAAAGPIQVSVEATPVAGSKLPKLVAPAKSPARIAYSTYNSNPRKYAEMNPLILSYCPALHLPDEDTFMENIPTVADLVGTLRAALPDAKFRFDPVTLNSPYPRPADDPRNRGLFGAAWSVRLLKYLGLAGADEAAFNMGPGYGSLIQQRIGAHAGSALLNVVIRPKEQAPVDALAIAAGGKRIVWLANLTDTPKEITLTGLAPATTARLAMLDQTTPIAPEASLPAKTVATKNGAITVTLDAFAVGEIEF